MITGLARTSNMVGRLMLPRFKPPVEVALSAASLHSQQMESVSEFIGRRQFSHCWYVDIMFLVEAAQSEAAGCLSCVECAECGSWPGRSLAEVHRFGLSFGRLTGGTLLDCEAGSRYTIAGLLRKWSFNLS